MTKTYIAKKVINVVIGIGTTTIVSSIVKNNTNPEKLTEQVTIVCASFVLGSMMADATRLYTDAKIDEITAWWAVNVKK